MAIHYEVHTIDNASGTGKKRQYIQLLHRQTLSDEQLEERIEKISTANAADVRVVLSALQQVAAQELAKGNHVHLPGIGWLSLAVGNTPLSKKANGKLTGKDIYVKTVRFRPEEKFLRAAAEGVSFQKADVTTRSAQLTDGELLTMLKDYLAQNHYITRRGMQIEFGLSKFMALKRIRQFTADGILRKEGSDRNPFYVLAD